jgi:hypothetical protein
MKASLAAGALQSVARPRVRGGSGADAEGVGMPLA